MPVTDKHAEYNKRYKQWERCCDAASGTDAIKNRGTERLPMLGGQEVAEYEAYKDRALFFGATKRTIQGMLGAIFRKSVSVEYPDTEQQEEAEKSGNILGLSSIKLTKEMLKTGRVGMLVDVMAEGNPYIATYGALDIVNWSVTMVEGVEVFTRVVLRETYNEPGEDEFDVKTMDQYRVLELQNNTYFQRLFRSEQENGEYVEIFKDGETQYPLVPRKNGLALDYIPFVIANSYGLGAETEEPPLLDLTDVNISHYHTSADLEHGAHFTALPTAWIAGFPADSTFKIGSSVAWVSENVQAKAGFLEYTGQGLSALQDLMKSKEKKMAVLGARMLEEQKASVEAADTLHMRASGETGALMAMVRSASDAVEAALTWAAEWSSLSGDIAFRFNTDFAAANIDPQLLIALMGARQSGEITQETFLYNLQQGELLRPGVSIEDEISMIEIESPAIVKAEIAEE